jgi:hypothetical protein
MTAVAFVVAGSASAAAPQIIGASAKQRQVLTRLWSNMPGTAITAIVLHGSTIAFRATRDDERVKWEEYVLAVAFRDTSIDAHLPPVQRVASSDGSDRLDDDVPVAKPAPSDAKARAALESKVRALVSSAGGTVVELRVFRLRGLAVAVHMRTDNAAAFIKHDALAVTGALRSAAKIGCPA